MKKIKFIVKFVLGRIVYFFSGFFPRKSNLWAFGSFNGFEDNPKHLYLYMLKNNKDIRVVWLAKNPNVINQAEKFGGEVYSLYSVKGFFIALTAGVYIYSAYLTDISFITSRNARKVNLWHGIPIKKIEFDINSAPLVNHFSKANFLYRQIYAYKHMRPDLILCPSKYSSDYTFKSAFRVTEDECLFARYPRVTALLEMTPKTKSTYDKIFLYMPTWRDSNIDLIKTSGIDFEKLNLLMASHNCLLIFKPHPLTNNGDVADLSHIRIPKEAVDLNELLLIADCLITDYSSVIFDYLHLDRPIIFFNYDMNEYQRERELYFNYDSIVCGTLSSNFDMLISALERVIYGVDRFKEKRNLLYNKFTSEIGGNEVIINKIKLLVNIRDYEKST